MTHDAASAPAAFLADTVARLIRETGCTKRSALRLAIIDAIYTGVLEPGAMLPPERHLARTLGLSLGTVQAAMVQLRQAGRLTRRRGDGTRVADHADHAQETWHFRLCDRQTGLPVFWVNSEVEIEPTHGCGPCQDFLGADGPVVRVRRRIRMLNEAPVGAEMYLPMALGRHFLGMNPTDLALINLRGLLVERLGIACVPVSTQIATTTITSAEAARFRLDPDAQHFMIDARVNRGDGLPAYFQRVIAGCAAFSLRF